MKLRGSIENRNGKFSLRYSVHADGGRKYKRVALQATTRKDAQREAALLSASLPTHINTYTFSDFIGDLRRPAAERDSLWQDYLNGRQVQESTQNVHNMMARYFVEAIGHKDVTTITPADITMLLQNLRSRISQGSLVVAYRALILMFRVLIDHDRIEKSPVRKTLHVVSKPKTKKPSLTLEQFQQLLQVIDPILKLPVLLMGITGLRQGECFGLQWQDFHEGALHITGKVYRRQRQESVKTESSARKIILPTEVVTLLHQQRAETTWSAPHDFIFAARDGRAPNSELYRYKYLWPALQQVGVQIKKHTAGYHLIRHSVGRIAYEITRDPKAVQMLLGHAVIATTMNTYCQPDASVPGAVANRIYQQVSSYVN